ncbi:MAG: phosphoenolpyruvate carboxylase [Xanthomonadales bacterium]|nr:phosphoenolpyruvate carboxylase [Xanthomonadales bacterium]
MEEIRVVDLPEKDWPLRADVSLLGSLVGKMLVEQGGQALLDRVEQVRKAAIADRERGDKSGAGLQQVLGQLRAGEAEDGANDEIGQVIHAFSSYMRTVNLAEKVHRIRRRRSYQRARSAAQRGSLDEVIGGLKAAGVELSVLQQALNRLSILPVFTAHPTEATRRTLQEKEYEIVLRLVDRLNPELTPEEKTISEQRMLSAISSAWQTRLVSHTRPTVADELDNILFYITDILYRVVPVFYESLDDALQHHYGAEAAGTPAPEQQMLRFGSWVGGDMDGNPNVHAGTILETLVMQRKAIIRRYLPEVTALGRSLSQSLSEIAVDEAVLQRVSGYEDLMPEVAKTIVDRYRDMPYRCLLRYVVARLQATVEDGQRAYESAEQLIHDLSLIEHSLQANKGEHAGMFAVRRLLQRVRCFGFHMATLDVRQDAELHRRVMAEWLARPDWAATAIEDRSRILAQHLAAEDWPDLPAAEQQSQDMQRTLEVFKVLGEARQRFGAAATGLFIISMTQGADDVLTVMALAQVAGAGTVDIAPLLETVNDLQAGPDILAALLAEPVYLEHLQKLESRQVIMVGYSDSNKDSGIAASRWALQEAQGKLLQVGREQGIAVVYFHGRGGTVSRGGGNLVNGILGAPAGTVNGYMRLTEQGEVINRKYGVRPIALRNLELMTGATLQHSMDSELQLANAHIALTTPEGGSELMNMLAQTARQHYRGMVYEQAEFADFFRAFTPIDVIERLTIGSRPPSRRCGAGIANLRAIPWVFSWAQTRIGLPGVYGMGTALQNALTQFGNEHLRRLLQQWPFFRALIEDVEMVLAKSELRIGLRYASLVVDEHRFLYEKIEAEFLLAHAAVLELKQTQNLLDDQPTLQRNIRLRNPYVDPLHMLQVDLLRRWRDSGREDDRLLKALMATVNGISLGIQNTG